MKGIIGRRGSEFEPATVLSGELEIGATCQERDHQRIQRDPLLLGALDQMRVQGRGKANLGLAARFGHGILIVAYMILFLVTTKRAGGATNTPAPATGGSS